MQKQLPLALVESTKNLFATMLSSPVTFGAPAMCEHPAGHDVSAIISYSGDISGSVVLGLSGDAAVHIASRLAGVPLEPGSADLTDAIGEVINMIAGGAKARLNGRSISMSCPSVIHAPGHLVRSPGTLGCISVPCKTGDLNFNLYCVFQSIANMSQSKPAVKAA
jgi:chemotaxis protein CheX